MQIHKIAAAFLACSALAVPVSGIAQSFPKIPKIKVPSLPKVPAAVERVAGAALPDNVQTPSVPGYPQASSGASSGDLTEAYMADGMIVAQGTSIAGNSAANDERLDKEIAVYRAAVDRLASGRYNSVPAQMRKSLDTQMMRYFDQRTQRVDADIAFINGKVAENSGYDERIGTRVYNGLISLESEMYAANILFPGRSGYSDAKAKVDAMVTKFGSRGDQANNALDETGAANAAKVKMPPAIAKDKNVEAMFRRAFASGGIPYTIKKVNIRSGWRDRREYGRVIGQTRKAAIGAKDPNSDRCNLYDFTMFRDTSGAVSRLAHSTTRIACENIK